MRIVIKKYIMNNIESTHIIFDWENVVISPNLGVIFDFLINIEKEVESLLNFEKKLEEIRKSYIETLWLTSYLAKKIEENNIDIDYQLLDHPENIVDKFNFHLPMRSQFIVLFSQLETLFCLYIAYLYKTNDEKIIREKTMNQEETRKFINKFILSHNNEYYNENRKIFSKVSANQIREFRNSLTHFFSVKWWINIVHNELNETARKLEKIFKEKWSHNTIFININDLFLLLRYASRNILRLWSNDYLENTEEFKERILFVKSVVDNNSSFLINNKDLKF